MRQIKTKSGDTWDSIALRELGSELLMNKVIDANLQYSQIVIFDKDTLLNIPEISTENNSNLPPWRR